MVSSKSTVSPAQRALTRVRKISQFNSWSVVVVAGLSCLVALLLGDLVSLFIGLLVVGAGVMERRGLARLRHRDADGMKWLVRSQLFLLSVVLVYAVSRLASFDGETAMGNLTPEMRTALQEMGINPAELLPLVHLMVGVIYGTLIIVTCVFQGGLALYYRRKSELVATALREVPYAAAAQAVQAAGWEQRFYDAVAAEMQADQFVPGLWARALAESDGHEARCEAIYVKLRVAELAQGKG